MSENVAIGTSGGPGKCYSRIYDTGSRTYTSDVRLIRFDLGDTGVFWPVRLSLPAGLGLVNASVSPRADFLDRNDNNVFSIFGDGEYTHQDIIESWLNGSSSAKNDLTAIHTIELWANYSGDGSEVSHDFDTFRVRAQLVPRGFWGSLFDGND